MTHKVNWMLVVVLGVVALAGCNQDQRTKTLAQQSQPTTAQQAQDGPRNNVNVVTNPHGRAAWTSAGYTDQTEDDQSADGPPGTEDVLVLGTDRQGVHFGMPAGGSHNYSITIENITQTVTSELAGSQTQTPTGTMTPSASGGSMVQEPKASSAVPITVSAAPGSSAQGGSTAAAVEGSTGAQSSANQATIDYLRAELKAKGEQMDELMKQLRELKNPPVTTQPAEESPGTDS